MHSREHRAVVPAAAGAAVMGYASVSFVLAIIRGFGAPAAELAKGMRKVLQARLVKGPDVACC